ncbi:MAG: tetratricopeptide repeat protein, partial [Actinomycetota bacterium]|nr:tetratricopeptide repeat protein [Actinomycetota bacterium]
LPDLAMSLNNLAIRLAEVGQRQAALAPAQQAADTYRALAEANPEAYLPDLAASLNNLAIRLAEVGQRQAALAPAQQAADTYRALAQANPEAYLPNLAASLNNLANRLAEVGQPAKAVDAYTTSIDALAGSPAASATLRVERARFRLTHGDASTGLRELTELLAAAGSGEPGTVVISVRRALRAYRETDRAGVERTWRAVHGSDPPEWLALTDEQIDAVIEWINTPNWAESKEHLAAHAGELQGRPASVALDELRLLDADQADRHRQLLTLVREHGIEQAYRPLLLRELLTAWIGIASWAESRSFAEQHADDLLAPEAADVLARLGDIPAVTVHLAVLGLARRDGIDAAYGCVTDRQRAADRMGRALLEADPSTVLDVAMLEGYVFTEVFTATAHLALARVMSGEPIEDTTDLAALAEQADVAERQRVAAEIAELIGRVPEHAGPLSALLSVLLRPTGT